MKKIIGVAIFILVCQVGCGNGSVNDEYQQIVEDISHQPSNDVSETKETEELDNIKKDLAGELSILLYKNVLGDALLEKYAAAFMEENPEVTIDINIANLNPETTYDDIVTEANVAFSSGEVEDIIDLTPLPYLKYMENGYLTDMYEYLNNDPEIDRVDYYWNIVEAREYKQSLSGIVLSVNPSIFFVNKEILDKIEVDISDRVSISILEMWEWYFKAVENGTIDQDYSIGGGWAGSIQLMLWQEIESFIDRENKTTSFVSEDFVALLKRAKETGFPYEYREGAQVGDSPYDILKYIDGPMEQFSLFWHQGYIPDEIWSTMNTYISQPLICESSDGKIPISTTEFYGISNACENKELAWEFLKYCMEGKEWVEGHTEGESKENIRFDKYGRSSVNRKNTYEIYSSVFGKIMADGIDQLNRSDFGGSQVDGGSMFQVVEDCVRAYIDEDIGTAESVAEELQSRFEIYMNE